MAHIDIHCIMNELKASSKLILKTPKAISRNKEAGKETEDADGCCDANPPDRRGAMQMVTTDQEHDDGSDGDAHRHRGDWVGDHEGMESVIVRP